MRRSRRNGRRDGLGPAEVVVLVAIVFVLVLAVALALPRMREGSRSAACQRNLMQIGVALSLYAQATDQFPTVPPPGPVASPARPSPFDALLLELGQVDFSQMADPSRPPAKRSGVPVEPRFVAGFACPTDTLATSGNFPAPVSYRANAGSDPAGSNGPFAPGQLVRPGDVTAGDGLAYTAAFAERLVGTGGPGQPGVRDYRLVDGLVADGKEIPPNAVWAGNAGSNWLEADWRSTLYNHALPPNGRESWIARDGRTAAMGASSAHLGRVHVLMLDGSLRPFTPTIAPGVWRQWGGFRDEPAARAPGPVPPSPSPMPAEEGGPAPPPTPSGPSGRAPGRPGRSA